MPGDGSGEWSDTGEVVSLRLYSAISRFLFSRCLAMLVLSRKKNESIVIDPRNLPVDENGLVEIVVVELRGDKVRLGITAPKKMPVHRKEVHDAIHQVATLAVAK
jgi:carbon storage regulator